MEFTRRLSPETQELVARLRAPRKSIFRRGTSAAECADVIAQIGRQKEPAALPFLLDFAFDTDPRIRWPAQTAVSVLVQVVPIREIPWLDEHIRKYMPWGGAWSTIQPRCVDDLRISGTCQSLLFLGTVHNSGFVREAAVRSLSETDSGEELPYIVVRLNDWVEAVRDAARDAYLERIRPEMAPAFVRCLPLVLRLQHCGRTDHSEILGRTGTLLTSDSCVHELIEGLVCDEKAVRRASYQIGTGLAGRSADLFLSKALESRDPSIRLQGARRLYETPDNSKRKGSLDVLLRDPFGPVRIVALDAIRRESPAKAEEMLRNGLFDRNSSVRRYCQYYLKAHHGLDPAEPYCGALQSDQRQVLVAAISGLCEIGIAREAGQVLGKLGSSYPSVRAAAIRFVGLFCGPEYNEHIINTVCDHSPSVSKAAVGALRARGTGITVEIVNRMLQDSTKPHVRVQVLKLTANAGYWAQPLVLLPACDDVDQNVRQSAHGLFLRWLVRSRGIGLLPTGSEKELLATALCNFGHCLSAGSRSEYEFLLKTIETNR